MADKIVSPGVFTKENDLSFLQQGVADIGAAFIGPFKEGPLVPTIVNSQAEFEKLFGAADGTYLTPLAVQNYLREAGTATICRVGGVGGYTEVAPLLLTATSGAVSASLGILFNTSGSANGGFADAQLTSSNAGAGDFVLRGSGLNLSASLDVTDTNDIEAVFGTSAFGSKDPYVYGFFKNSSITFNSSASSSVTVLGDQLFTFDAQEALTPMITSQVISGDRYNLFQFETIGAGNAANTKVKIGITNIKAAGSVNGTDYAVFTVVVTGCLGVTIGLQDWIGRDNLIFQTWLVWINSILLATNIGSDEGKVLNNLLGVFSLTSTGLTSDQHRLIASVPGHASIGIVGHIIQMWWHFVLLLATVEVHHLHCVQWQTLEGVDGDAEET